MAQNLIVTKIIPSFSFLETKWEKDQHEIEGSFLKIIKIKEESLNSG